MIYDPAEDSFLLQRHVTRHAKGTVLDMGTGTGLLAEAARENGCEVLAVDINPEAVAFVRRKGIRAIVSDLFENVEGRFDLILFNPPYLPRDDEEEAESQKNTTGGNNGGEVLDRFLRSAQDHLTSQGSILLVVSTLTGDVEALFQKYGYSFTALEEQPLFFESLRVYLLRPRTVP